VGSALGSSIGQVLRLSDDRIRNLVGCGAAAGIAATFNAPIAGVVFAIEVLMGNLQVRSFGNVVIAAVSSSIVSRFFLGARPAFSVPIHSMVSPVSLVFYLLLGLLSALVGIMFIRMLNRAEDMFDNWDFPQIYKPAVGAALLGITGMIFMYLPGSSGIFMPYMYGSGFHFIEQVLLENVPFWMLFLLIFLKPLATSFTLGSGNSGGVFAPSLFIGAMLGGCLGLILERFFPEVAGGSGAYALVGMAALFSRHGPGSVDRHADCLRDEQRLSDDPAADGRPVSAPPISPSGCTTSRSTPSSWPSEESDSSEGRDMDIMQGVKVERSDEAPSW
jgi:CIC family chloride channel protein